MNPRLMLSLWRERWGKAGDSNAKQPYLDGSLNRWSDQVVTARVWSLPGVVQVTVLLSLLGLAMVMTVDLSLNSQIVFAVLVAAVSLYARRYGGPWVTLLLVGFFLIASARYLFWRFDATLSPHLDIALVLGFALCTAELHVWTLNVLGLLSGAYPLKRAPRPLSANTAEWPTVDVFVPCHGLSPVAIEQLARAAQALEWPSQRIKRYLLDNNPTGHAQMVAHSLGLIYLSTYGTDAGPCDSINQALSKTRGDWIVVLDGNHKPVEHFLTSVAGWMADPTLAMMQTATHFLAPVPSKRSLAIMGTPELGGSCALIRRSALSRIGGLTLEPVMAKAHTALKLQALGYGHAYIGFTSSPVQNLSPNHPAPLATQLAPSPLDAFRIDQPFSDRALYWRQRLSTCHAMLQFYRVVPMLIFFTAPLAYLLAEVQLIQTSPELLLAYLLPHWLQGYFAQARFGGNFRFTVLEELKEMALGLCILIATTLSVSRTTCKRWLTSLHQQEKRPIYRTLNGVIVWPYAVAMMMSLVVFMSGIAQFVLSNKYGHDMEKLYLAWVGYNLLMLSAVLAVAQESEHIRQHTHRQKQRPATVRWSSGRAVPCVTQNFPDPVLILELPAPMTLAQGSKVNVSVFRQDREFVFPAEVVSSQGETFCVNIQESVRSSYQALGATAFSRGPDWPKWLPGRHADQPFPPWLIAAFVALHSAVLNYKNRLSEWSWWMLVGGWKQRWKKK